MIFRSKKNNYFAIVISLFVLFFIGKSLIEYYFDSTPPVILLQGIEHEKSYAGNIAITLTGIDGYRIKYFSVYIDNKIIVDRRYIHKKKFTQVFDIPIFNVTNGMHTLKVVMVDDAKNENKSEKIVPFIVDNEPLEINLLNHGATSMILQGNTVHIIVQCNKNSVFGNVQLLSHKIPLIQESKGSRILEAFVPVSPDEFVNEYIAEISVEDMVGNLATVESVVKVVQQNFRQQAISISKKQENGSEINFIDDDILEALKAYVSEYRTKKLWSGNFYVPCTTKKISSEYGSMRHSQQRGRYRHGGVDFAAMPKSAVWASQNGVIAIQDEFIVPGKMVLIDHGGGVFTMYGHLDSFSSLKVGDRVKRGDLIGRVGKSGYASGYHLHFGVLVDGIWVNPVEWIREDMGSMR